MTDSKVDLNTIPYDAPLSFPAPSQKWILEKSNNGRKSTTTSVAPADKTGKWVIITGSNNGIGREAALQMAEWGANLILGCRNPPPHEQLPSDVVEECKEKAKKANKLIEVEWWEVNMADLGSVERFAKRWLDTGRPLDILCNNAGMGSSPGSSKVFKTKDGFEIIHQVNFLSHVLLTLTLLPSIAKAKTPRIVCTTSCFHFLGRFDLGNMNGEKGDTGAAGVNYYQNNKLWFQIWLTELQHRLLTIPEYKHITINGVHPGYVNSGIWTLNGKGWLDRIRQVLVQLLAYFFAINTQQGSLAILHAATSETCGPDPEVQGVGKFGGKGGGRYFNRIWEEEPMPHTKDPDCRMRVWRKVNDELKLQQKGLLDIVGLKYIP